jgi:hypothetical protein
VNVSAVTQHPARWKRWLVAAAALAAVAAAVPALPAVGASLAAPAAVLGSGASSGGGTVTVTRCSRGFLLASWQCRGTFAYSDPMAQSSRVTTNVILANDPHHYGRGAQVGVSLRDRTHRAYLWGTSYATGVVMLLLGFIWCAFLACLLLLTRRRMSTWASGCILAAGIALMSPTIAGLWS